MLVWEGINPSRTEISRERTFTNVLTLLSKFTFLTWNGTNRAKATQWANINIIEEFISFIISNSGRIIDILNRSSILFSPSYSLPFAGLYRIKSPRQGSAIRSTDRHSYYHFHILYRADGVDGPQEMERN